MKKVFVFLGLLAVVPLQALPIGEEGRAEARLFNTFLESVYTYKQNPSRSYELFQKALALQPDSKYLRRMLVSVALGMDKPELAEPYVDYINSGENESEDWAVYAAYQLAKREPVKALESYKKALEARPEDMDLVYRYVTLLLLIDERKAIEELEKLAKDQPFAASRAYAQIGRIYKRKQQWQTALGYLDKSVAADPTDPAAYLEKAEIYENTAQYFLMLHEFEELEKIGYGNAGMFSRMGAVFLVVKDVPKAEAYFLKAKESDPSDSITNNFLSLIAENRGEFLQAITYLQEAADYETNASRWLQVSFLQRKANMPKESLQTLRQAYKKFEGNVEIGFFYGLALNDNKAYKKAARVFEKIITTNPDYIQARLHYAYALESLKKYNAMEEQLKQILSSEPQNAPALNLWAYSLAERETRLPEAEQYSKKSLELVPGDVSFQDTLGWIYIKQGRLQEAERIFGALPAQVIMNEPELAYHMGVLRISQGRNTEALVYLEKAKDDWPAAKALYKKLSRSR